MARGRSLRGSWTREPARSIRLLLLLLLLPPLPGPFPPADPRGERAARSLPAPYEPGTSAVRTSLSLVSLGYSSPRKSGTSSSLAASMAERKSSPNSTPGPPSPDPASPDPAPALVRRTARSGSSSTTTPSGRTWPISSRTSLAELQRRCDVPMTT